MRRCKAMPHEGRNSYKLRRRELTRHIQAVNLFHVRILRLKKKTTKKKADLFSPSEPHLH